MTWFVAIAGPHNWTLSGLMICAEADVLSNVAMAIVNQIYIFFFMNPFSRDLSGDSFRDSKIFELVPWLTTKKKNSRTAL